MMSSKPPSYCSYILRCWIEAGPHENDPAISRYCLEDPHTGERHGFVGAEALMQFLRDKLENQGLQTEATEQC